MVGEVNEVELTQLENHMCLVHGLMLQLVELASRAEQMVLIVDLKKIKPKVLSNKMLITALKKVFALSAQYFPEFLYKGFVVNAPLSFSKLWSTLETQLPSATKDKIRVMGACTHPDILTLVNKSLNISYLLLFFL